MKVDTPKEAWSKWNDVDTYNKFQKSLRDAVKKTPIEWEGRAWIEIAQERNKQKNEECQ